MYVYTLGRVWQGVTISIIFKRIKSNSICQTLAKRYTECDHYYIEEYYIITHFVPDSIYWNENECEMGDVKRVTVETGLNLIPPEII